LWHQVTLTPDEIKIIVFNRGTPQGLKGWIPIGGQYEPSSTFVDRLAWKNAQKNDTKKKTSDVINSTIPHFNPVVTIIVCNPWKVLSRDTSRHHVNEIKIIHKSLVNIKFLLFLWNHLASPVVKPSPVKDTKIGQGDSSTIWNGWFKDVDSLYLN